jgi:hypothetical protein
MEGCFGIGRGHARESHERLPIARWGSLIACCGIIVPLWGKRSFSPTAARRCRIAVGWKSLRSVLCSPIDCREVARCSRSIISTMAQFRPQLGPLLDTPFDEGGRVPSHKATSPLSAEVAPTSAPQLRQRGPGESNRRFTNASPNFHS